MVDGQLRSRGIVDRKVLAAMLRVPRHRFIPPSFQTLAYSDQPIPIPDGQTISQPYIVALMTQAAALRGGEKVLEIGTGSGYQTAILWEMGCCVWSIERSPELHQAAADRLNALGYGSLHLSLGDGTCGYPDEAPFDRILATGSLPDAPIELLRQLRAGGIFIGPIGPLPRQQLVQIEYDPPSQRRRLLCACRFVPLIGAHGWADADDVEHKERSHEMD
jgi:protein-L-isoaspartate(D-aspartate) O-methyltransferase